ncbi:MAG: glycosyltransferase family 2 protein, partial [Flavobacteriales bacterium]|nr:glycosyltransferase family 2 protein [Flavobacteriales bacterium]
SFIRNAGTYDYPIVEAIRSILPVCDEVVVAVGASEDGTEDLVRSIDPRVRVLRTTWDDTLREGGRVLAEETNKALDAV